MDSFPEPFGPPIEPAPRSPRPRIVLAALLALALAAGAGFGLAGYLDGRARQQKRAAAAAAARARVCGSGVVKAPGTQECVGVSDGSYRFAVGDPAVDRDLDRLQRLIDTQNRAVGAAPHITVAYALPMPWRELGTLPHVSVLHQLAGAWAAQAGTNAVAAALKVRLEVANLGHDAGAWQPVSADLTDPHRANPVAVVAGLGQSIANVYAFAGQFSGAGIPLVGATVTADDLNGSRYPGLYRIGPSNTQEIAAALGYLRSAFPAPALDRMNGVYLIASGNDDDAYVVGLTRKFKAAVPHTVTYTYDGSAAAWRQTLSSYAASVCSAKPAAVYFAGRAAQLQYFVDQVGAQCDPRLPLTVLAGDDAASLTGSTDPKFAETLRAGATKVVYTAIGYPKAQASDPPERLGDLAAQLRSVDIAADLTDGGAMSAFDAVLLAVDAATLVAGQVPAGTPLGNLVNGFATYTRDTPLCGATGAIALVTDNSPRRGDTADKPIPVVRLGPGAGTTLLNLFYPEDGPRPHC